MNIMSNIYEYMIIYVFKLFYSLLPPSSLLTQATIDKILLLPYNNIDL